MAERELLARSPRSRKSLGAIGSEKENVGGKVMAGGIKGGGLGRKRAVSISGPSSVKMKDVELSPRRKARRSMVPRKSILKPANLPGEDATTSYDFTSTGSDQTQLIADVDGHGRKSMGIGSRRVSFAARASVRFFEQPTPGSPALSDSTASSSMSLASTAPSSQPGAFLAPPTNPRRSSAGGQRRRRSSVQNPGDDGEESMEMDDDSGNPPPFLSNQHPQYLEGSAIADDSDADGEFEEDPMELTNVTGAIVASSHSHENEDESMELASVASMSRRQSSIGGGEQTMELTVAIGEEIPRVDEHGNALPSKSPALAGAWAALESTTTTIDRQGSPQDMDLEDAMRRLTAARPSLNGLITEGGDGPDDDSSSDDDDGHGDMDFEKTMTMDITTAIGGIRSRASNVAPPPRPTTPERDPARPSVADDRTPQRVGTSTAAPSRIPVPSTSKSPSKNVATFSAAFAPSHTPGAKRPRSISAPSPSSTPNKKLAVGSSSASKRGVAAPSPAPPAVPIPSINIFAPPPSDTNAAESEQEPSEPAAKSEVVPQANKRVSSSFAMRRRKSSVLPTNNIFSASTSSAPKPVEPHRPRTPEEDREAVHESLVAVSLTPTRKSPHPASRPKSPGAHVGHQTAEETAVSSGPAVQWRDATFERRQSEVERPASISIARFLEMTNISFLDNLAINRLSTVPMRRASTESNGDEGHKTFSTADYAVAQMVFAPQLEAINWCCRELKKHITNAQASLKVYEADVEINMPLVFQDYLTSDDEKQDLIDQLFKVYKYHVRLETKSEWYRWRQNIVADQQNTADIHLKNLDAARESLSRYDEDVPTYLSEARSEYARLKAELEKERKEVAKVPDSDQEALVELREAIAEQNTAIQVYKADIADGNAKLDKVVSRLNEVDSEKQAVEDAISAAQNLCDKSKGYTTGKVFSLKGEYEALQRMHLWRFLKVTETQLNMTYDDHISISIPCQKYDPIPQRIQISLLPEEKQIGGRNSQFPVLSDIMVDAARKRLGHENDELEAIIRTLSVLWSSISRVRSELRLLTIKHPTNLVASSPDGTISLHVTAILLFPSVKSKVLVHFSFSEEVLCTWPLLLRRVGCNVEVVYGNVKAGPILKAIQGRIESVNIEENRGVLLDACADALSLY